MTEPENQAEALDEKRMLSLRELMSRANSARFRYRRTTFRPENVQRCIYVAVMDHSALVARPFSYSQPVIPSRAASRTARRAGYGTVSLVSFDIHRLPSGSLVPQHCPELRPARVQDRFCHPCLSKLSGIHIADDDQTVFVRQSRACDVEEVPSPIGDLGVDCSDAFPVAGALRPGEIFLFGAIKARGFDLPSIAHCGERLDAEINTDLAIAASQIVIDLALERHIPATARILDEGARSEVTLDIARPPEAISTLKINHGVTIDTQAARDERYPSNGPLRSETGSKSRAAPMLVSRPNELTANLVCRVGMNTEICGNACAKIDEINSARSANGCPHLPTPFIFALRSNAEVPHLITSNGNPVEVPPGARIFDPKFVGDHAHE